MDALDPLCSDTVHMTGELPGFETFYLNPTHPSAYNFIVSRHIQLKWLLHTAATGIETVGRIRMCIPEVLFRTFCAMFLDAQFLLRVKLRVR